MTWLLTISQIFYAKSGWIPYISSHVSLSQKPRAEQPPNNVRLLLAKDLKLLCQKDEQLLRQSLQDFSNQTHDFRLAFIPDDATLAWHHAREDFLSTELLGKVPDIKGALVVSESGQSTWCIWSRFFSKSYKDNVLYILRIVVDGEAYSSETVDPKRIQQVADCLSAAQEQAGIWGMTSVDLWNPSPTILAGCQRLNPDLRIIHRDQESIACLNWYGKQPGLDKVEWVANEKFAWC